MQTVVEYLGKNKTRFISELCDYVRIPSVSAQAKHGNDMQTCAKWLESHCQKIGMDAQIYQTAGHPIVIAKTPRTELSQKPHYLVYGHYDVQPPEPLELWTFPPFEPHIEGKLLFGRGASDNKGQHFAHLKAIEAYLQTGTPLPCDITFVIEGEEEVGNVNLPKFLRKHRAKLQCEGVVVSDNTIPSKSHPAITYAQRGLAALEIMVRGSSRDLHSGIFGGATDNPAMALCQMLGQLRDKCGRITIPGFYDDVIPLSDDERAQLARLPYSDKEYKKILGTKSLFGENGFTTYERCTARPTFEINGITSGYQGEGIKTIIPAWASAKITMRLVSNQNPQNILQLCTRHLLQLCPATVHLEVTPVFEDDPYLVSPTGPKVLAAKRALKAAFHREPVFTRSGGSIPILKDFKEILHTDSLLLGLALPDDGAHSPNEKFDLECFAMGMSMSAYLWQELALS